MPTAICKCGKKTNSATSNYWKVYQDNPTALNDVIPTECYAAIEFGKWVKGCWFDEASDFDKRFAITVIERDKEIRKGHL